MPVKQKKRSFEMEHHRIIEKEVNKLLKAKFSNVVVVPKAVEKWQMCMDFTDLNKACPMDPYPLPQIELLVDSTMGFALFSMMNAYQGYHQIFMAKEDRDKTSFITENGDRFSLGIHRPRYILQLDWLRLMMAMPHDTATACHIQDTVFICSQLTTWLTNPLKLHGQPTSPAIETRVQYLMQVSIGSSMPNLEVLDLECSRPTIRSWFYSCQTYAQPNSMG
ncbi:Retrovirus-related Pol polyprotein from transposon gypsy [Sesamum angolense]|uniref:Retrovirus-related Pol polyprotein from transposon gypsy n=1 Tax=Sesamum angolense TaxID=2727404 RepID=A0AAE1T6S6_9LAMI|nr:Retrovirus-related Pol polyprotein from transposon gypsy [Sesamum angolense]